MRSIRLQFFSIIIKSALVAFIKDFAVRLCCLGIVLFYSPAVFIAFAEMKCSSPPSAIMLALFHRLTKQSHGFGILLPYTPAVFIAFAETS